MRTLITIIFICNFLAVFSQNNLQYQNIKKLIFPSKIDTFETKGVKVFYTNIPDLNFTCMITTISKDSIINQKRFYRSLQIIIEGYFSSENWKYHQREQVDTIIGKVEGILVHGYEPSKPAAVKEFFDFFTIVDGKNYVITGGSIKDLTPAFKKEVDSFLQSLEFEGKNY